MRIISQDRKTSVEMRNVVIQSPLSSLQLGEFLIDAHTESKIFLLGQYESENRLKEVFDDIHKAYCPVTMVTTGMGSDEASQFVQSSNSCHRVIKMDDPGKAITTYDDFLYYMPEK